MNVLEDVEIIEAEIKDIYEILSLQKRAYQSEAKLYNDDKIQPLTQSSSEVQAELKSGIILKALLGKTIIGSVRAYHSEHTCYIGKLIVDPDYQRNGLGKMLMTRIETQFPEATRFELFTGSKSLKNIELYQKLNYEIFETKSINDQFSLVFMQKLVKI